MAAHEQLQALLERLKRIQAPALRRRLMKNLAAEALSKVADCFLGQRDPYGVPWAKVNFKGKRIGGQILRDTGRLMNGFRAHNSDRNFTVTNSTVYAAIHQYGGTIHHYARSEMRRYKVTGKGKRSRVKLFSKAANSVRAVATYGDGSTTIPPRPFLPYRTALPSGWVVAFAHVASKVLESTAKGGG